MKPRKHAELIKAWADGAEIEYLTISGTWDCINAPSWDDHKQYRIKQNTVKYRVALLDMDQTTAKTVYSEDEAKNLEKSGTLARWLTDWIEVEL